MVKPIAIFWLVANLPAVLMGLLLPGAALFGGGSVPVGGAGLFALLVLVFLAVLAVSVPTIVFCILVLKGKSPLGLQIMLGIELAVCFACAAVFWEAFHGQEAFIPWLLLGLAPALYIPSIILLRRGGKRSGDVV